MYWIFKTRRFAELKMVLTSKLKQSESQINALRYAISFTGRRHLLAPKNLASPYWNTT